MGRRTRHRGGCPERRFGRDSERTCQSDVRIRCHGGQRHPPSPPHPAPESDESGSEHRVSDQQRALRLHRELRGQSEGHRVGRPMEPAPCTCLPEQPRRIRARLAVSRTRSQRPRRDKPPLGAYPFKTKLLPPRTRHGRGRPRRGDRQARAPLRQREDLQPHRALPAHQPL